MKKVWCNFLGCLLIGVFTCNVVMNILTYNLWYKVFFINEMIYKFENSFIVLTIAIAVFLVISVGINISSMYLFNRLSRKNIEKVTDEEKKYKMKKVSRIFVMINLILYALCIIKWFIDITQYNYDLLNYVDCLYDKDIDIKAITLVLTPIYLGAVNIIILVCFILMNLLVIIPIKNTFKMVKKKKSILTNIAIYTYLFLFIALAVASTAYYYIDIPEFNYIYEFQKEEGNIYASVMEFSDIRKLVRDKEYVVPNRIWNNDVICVQSIYDYTFRYPNLKIIISSDTIFNKLTSLYEDGDRYYTLYGVNTGVSEIEIRDNTGKWHIDNFILLDEDQTEAYIFTPWKSGDVYIPATVKNIYYKAPIAYLNGNNIIIDDNNPYYYVYDNAIYTKPGALDQNDFVILDEKLSNEARKHFYQLCCPISDYRKIMRGKLKLPSNLKGSLSIFGLIDTIIIPKELRNPDLYISCVTVNHYEIEEGNDFYIVENGSLLIKDQMKLIALSESSSEKSEYTGSGVYIGDTVRDIDEKLLKDNIDIRFNVSPNNPYIEKIENGIITYKNVK